MRFTAAGDAIIGRNIQNDFQGYEEISSFINKGDARFFNLETTLNYEGECFTSQFSGGTYLRTNPELLQDLKKFGFNITSFNNNHAMDYSYDGLLKTLDFVKKSGLVNAGVGRNLAEASAPKYLETSNGRVALISANTTFDPAMMAGVQTERIKGRPGINGIRSERLSVVTKENFECIKNIAEMTKINAYEKIMINEGYATALPDNIIKYGNEKFCLGEMNSVKNILNADDMARMERSIFEAQLQADYIIVSVHSHELYGESKENPSDFLIEFAHRCIDMGANAIIGHGPHLLRPIEVYKDCPIFYSLGDFILQLYNIEFAPAEMYEKYGLSHGETIHKLLKTRSKDFKIGLMEEKKMFETVIPYWETKKGKLKKLSLMPVQLQMSGNKSEIGLPRRDYDLRFAQRFIKMCEPYGVKINIESNKMLECSW